MRIYLIFDHDGHGLIGALADTDPARFHVRALEWLDDRGHLDPGYMAVEHITTEMVVGTLDAGIARATPGRDWHFLFYGWGGPTIRVLDCPD